MFRVLDLFSGAAGGWSAGLERTGRFRTVAFAEADPWRRACFAAAHPGAVAYADVRSVTAGRLVDALGYLPEIVVGSPPCQDISAANTRGQGIGGDRSGLFWEWLRVVAETRPRWACAENSPRARTHGIDHIIGGLDAIGYAVWPLVVGADNAGAPHRRKRMWLIAADAACIGGREGRTEPARQQGRPDRELGGGRASPDAASLGCDGRRESQRRPQGRDVEHGALDPRDAPDTEHCRCQGRQQEGQGAETALPPAIASIGCAWSHWNGGLAGLAASCAAAGFGRVDDGIPAGPSAGLRNRCISAYGDAVVPGIPEAIGRAILAAEGRVAA